MLPYFTIGSELVYTYPLFLGFLTGFSYTYCRKLIKLKQQPWPGFNFYYLGVFLSAWAGSKILFLLTVAPEVQAKAILNHNFWLGGGLVFYGGLIFGGMFTFIYAKVKNISLHDLNFLVPVIVIVHAIGRLGCFLAGCCYGKRTEFLWGVYMHGHHRHPVQLIEALGLVVMYFWILKRYQESKSVFLPYLQCYAVLRFFLEFLRGDVIRGVYFGGISTSQLVSLGLVLMAIVYQKMALFVRE